MKIWFQGEAKDRAFPYDRFLRIITESYSLHWIDRHNQERSLVVPVGFVTDLASVPSPLWSIIPPFDNWIKDVAICHDRAYETNEISRSAADLLLFHGMRHKGASYHHAYAVWAGVRIGGHWSYKTGKERQQKRIERLRQIEKLGIFNIGG